MNVKLVQATRRALHRERLAGIGLVNLATLLWASNIIAGRWLRNDAGPLTLAAARFLIASACFAVVLRRQKGPAGQGESRPGGHDRWLLAGMALTGVVLFTPALYLGLHDTTAVKANFINGLSPLIAGLMAALLVREATSGRQIAGAVAGLLGMGLLISNGSLAFLAQGFSLRGDPIVLGSVALWGLYSVLAGQVMRGGRPALSATAVSTWLGLPLLLLAAAWEMHAAPVAIRPATLLAILYIGVGPTSIGFLAWNAGLRRLGASSAMVFYNTMPLYGAVLGVALLHERVGVIQVLGGAFIIGGGLWAAFDR
jgi:drug/metabolite transporter (DMT)-like permease